MNPYDVLLQRRETEKTDALREKDNKYSFYVDLKASKVDIRRAIEKFYEVKVMAVNTLILRGKQKRRGQRLILGPKKKKAIVTLKAGQTLKIFD